MSGAVLSGEGRVALLKPRYAVLTKPGLDGRVFVVPSNIVGQQYGYPDMTELLRLNDIVRFRAAAQAERNGIKWQALDGSIKVIKEAADVEYRDTGIVDFLDKQGGQYGFIRCSIGTVWFNANSVRPSTRNVNEVLRLGQEVMFVAIKQQHPSCPYRATQVQAKSRKLVPVNRVSPLKPCAPGKSLIEMKPQRSSPNAPVARPKWNPPPIAPPQPAPNSELRTNANMASAAFCQQPDVNQNQPLAPVGRKTLPRTQILDIILTQQEPIS